MDGKMDT